MDKSALAQFLVVIFEFYSSSLKGFVHGLANVCLQKYFMQLFVLFL